MLRSRACLFTSLSLSLAPARALNRLLYEPHELSGRTVSVPADDRRAQHVGRILRRAPGDTLRVGLVDGQPTDDAVLAAIESDGALRIELPAATPDVHAPAPRPRVDLLLALPRPLQLERILPMVAQLGVGTLVLAGARKVELSYWGSHLLRARDGAAHTRACLLDGLAQCGDTALPRVTRAKDLARWCEEELEALFPRDSVARVVAHAQRAGVPAHGRLRDVPDPAAGTPAGRGARTPSRLLLAVGPEGGWDEPDEVALLERHGFMLITLGERVLRSDVAVVSLLALAHETVRCWPPDEGARGEGSAP